MKLILKYWLIILSLVFDCLAITLSLVLAYGLRNNWLTQFFPQTQDFVIYWQALPWITISLVIIFFSFGLYQKQNRQSSLIEAGLMIKAVTFWLICLMALAYLKRYEYSRLIMIQLWFWALIVLSLGRYFLKLLKKLIVKSAWFQIPTLVVGYNSYSQEIVKKLTVDSAYKFKGYFVFEELLTPTSVPVFSGNNQNLYQIIVKENIQQVFLAADNKTAEDIMQLIDNCPNKQISFRVSANVFPLVQNYIWTKDKLELLPFVELTDLPEIDLSKTQPNFIYLSVKRLIDFIGALLGLVIASPLFVLIVWLIKKDTAGSSVIVQDRVGKNGQNFKLYKFRTMFQDTQLYNLAPLDKGDPRVTKIGRTLRRFSLDELPQLINVLKGEMSLVGPRPEMPFIVEQYNSWQRRRLTAKPGLTGLWQVLGRKDIPLQDNLQYDFYYINNQSLLLDLSIILKTIPMIIKGKGAF